MPISLPNTTTTDNFPLPGQSGAIVQGQDIFATGWFTVANAAVIAQYFYGQQGVGDYSPSMYLAPGVYPLSGTDKNPVNGIRFRSANTGTPAQVWGAFFYKQDPVLQSSAEFTSTVSATGGITPQTTGNMVLISDQIVAVLGNIISFLNIPQTFKHLKIFWALRSDQAVNISSGNMRFNNDAGLVYENWFHTAIRDGTTASTGNSGLSSINGLIMPGNPFSVLGPGEWLIPNYTNTSGFFSMQGVSSIGSPSGTAGTDPLIRQISGVYAPGIALPISRIDLIGVGNFKVGSRVTLYGLN